ncbi:redoxin family protein [Isoptericola halotolerans]|uniref:TlpA family protein disulfide reductase n=1 Tax=Isoptericola halotolerans TaxID=300560 RepID=UPI00388F3859
MNRRLHRTAVALATTATLTVAGCAADPEAAEPASDASGDMASEMPADEAPETAMSEEGMTSEPMDDEAMDDDEAGEEMSAEATPAVYDFSGTTLDGEPFDGASLEGGPAVLWFWAPWCPTCIMQIPAVTDLAETYGDDVAVVGVGGLDDAAAISDMAEQNISGITHVVDEAGEVWQHFGITQQSTFVVLDAAGEVVLEGSVPESELEAAVADLAG